MCGSPSTAPRNGIPGFRHRYRQYTARSALATRFADEAIPQRLPFLRSSAPWLRLTHRKTGAQTPIVKALDQRRSLALPGESRCSQRRLGATSRFHIAPLIGYGRSSRLAQRARFWMRRAQYRREYGASNRLRRRFAGIDVRYRGRGLGHRDAQSKPRLANALCTWRSSGRA